MANALTCGRMVISIALLFVPPLSPAFFLLYLLAGLSDLLDGPVARKTHTSSSFGARLDTAADTLFFAVVVLRLAPDARLSAGVWIWAGGIAALKAATALICLVMGKGIVSVHSLLNKTAGALLFLWPLSFRFISPQTGAAAVCAVSTLAAVQEGYLVIKRKTGVWNA